MVNTKSGQVPVERLPGKITRNLRGKNKQVEEDLLGVPKLIVSVLPWFDPYASDWPVEKLP